MVGGERVQSPKSLSRSSPRLLSQLRGLVAETGFELATICFQNRERRPGSLTPLRGEIPDSNWCSLGHGQLCCRYTNPTTGTDGRIRTPNARVWSPPLLAVERRPCGSSGRTRTFSRLLNREPRYLCATELGSRVGRSRAGIWLSRSGGGVFPPVRPWGPFCFLECLQPPGKQKGPHRPRRIESNDFVLVRSRAPPPRDRAHPTSVPSLRAGVGELETWVCWPYADPPSVSALLCRCSGSGALDCSRARR